MSKIGDAIKDFGKDWGKFPKTLASDVKSLSGSGWPPGTTLREKNAYRFKVAVLCAAGAFTFMPFSLALLLITAAKLWNISRDKK